MTPEESMRNMKLAQMRLLASAILREAGDIDTDQLVAASMEYARAAGEWRALLQQNLACLPDPTQKRSMLDRFSARLE